MYRIEERRENALALQQTPGRVPTGEEITLDYVSCMLRCVTEKGEERFVA